MSEPESRFSGEAGWHLSRQTGRETAFRRSVRLARAARTASLVLACFLCAASVFASDDIHWTITGPTSVSVDWRGTDATLYFGLTSSYGQSMLAVSQAGLLCDPAAAPSDAGSGPYMEAKVTGLQGDTVYHYKVGSGGPDHTFRTPPLSGASGFNVMAESDMGDSTSYTNMATVQSMIASDLPSLVLVVGDLTYKHSHGYPHDVQHFNDVMVWSQDAAYMPAWGNAEWDIPTGPVPKGDDLRNYKGRFDFPNPQSSSPNTPIVSDCGEDWYWFDYGNTRFISVPEPAAPTGSSSSSAARTAWNAIMNGPASPMLAAQNDPNIRFIVTYGHRPAYSSGHHPGEAALKGYLDALGCKFSKYVLNLNGHSHNYERSYPQKGSSCANTAALGVVHITAGTGGASLEQDGTCLYLTCTQPSWSAARYMRQGITKLSFSPFGIDGKYLCGPTGGGTNDVNCAPGDVIDTFTVAAGTCGGMPNGTACNDGNACTTGDVCGGGACAGTAMKAPAETQSLSVATDKKTFRWSTVADVAHYDVVRGSTGSFPVGPGGGEEVGFEDLATSTLSDATVPAAGAGFWYLSRGENACGTGTYGTQSNGSPRTTTTTSSMAVFTPVVLQRKHREKRTRRRDGESSTHDVPLLRTIRLRDSNHATRFNEMTGQCLPPAARRSTLNSSRGFTLTQHLPEVGILKCRRAGAL